MNNPDLEQIGSDLKDLGLLIGLLKGTNAAPELNMPWFNAPDEALTESFNWPHLQPIAESFMESVSNPLDNDEGSLFNERWYSINVDDGEGGDKASGFYIVQKTIDDNAYIGLGLYKSFSLDDEDKTTIEPFVFLPIIMMPAGEEESNSPLIAIDENGPLEVGFKFKYGGKHSDKLPFKQVVFSASFKFDDPRPVIECVTASADNSNPANIPTNPKEIINLVLGIDEVAGFLGGKVIPDTAIAVTWGGLLHSLGWLTTAQKPFQAGTIAIPVNGLLKYIIDALKTAFDQFMTGTNEIELLKHEPAKPGDPSWKMSLIMDSGRYGVNVQVADVVVSKSPLVKLQFGNLTADKTDWLKAAGGGDMPKTKGFNFFLLNNGTDGIKFDPHFEAISVGLDVSKGDKQPLFDVKGYALKQAQLRGYFSTLKNNKWGVATSLNGIAIPLVPSAKSDGVPQTLLAAGKKTSAETSDKKPPVNPEFSLLTAYQNAFYLQLFDKNGKPQNIVSIPLQKAFGPVALKDVGIGWKNDKKTLLFQLSGGLDLDALKLDLDKLTVGVPVTRPDKLADYTLSLDGFGLTFKSGAVSMSGGFLKDDNKIPNYNGAVAIQAAKWGITAMGSFGAVDGQPSLFIFGVLNAALGGPAVFFITGAAAGFGYNRRIVMPSIDQVKNFPFVKAAVNPELFSGKDTDSVLKSMSQVIPPELGQYWFAAGVKFTSFELLNSFALLMLQFGKKFEVDLLGLSTLQLPKAYADPKLKPYVNAEMAIKATFEPEEGVLAVQAQLSDNSYVIDPACKVTGGFAYYSWFNGKHKDDFVVTMGGYHKNFDKAAYPHYPTVPRLAFNWKVSSSIYFGGEAYFALTPSCVMAGGKLALTYQEGDLQAWFKAVADFLIAWKPFHYDIAIGITVGVSYKVTIAFISKTIALELGVNVQLWGPKFGGQAEVSLWIISFTVNFGEGQSTESKTITWDDFYGYFLTGEDVKDQLKSSNIEPAIGKTRQIIAINTSDGLKEKYVSDGMEYWVVDPGLFNFNAMSVFPVSRISYVKDTSGYAPPNLDCTEFGVKPMGNIVLGKGASNFIVGLAKLNDQGRPAQFGFKDWVLVPDRQNVPEAMFGTVQDPKEKPAAKLIPDVTKGIGSAKAPTHNITGPAEFAVSNINYSLLAPKNYGLNAGAILNKTELASDGSLDRIHQTLNAEAVVKKRKGIFDALTDLNSLAANNKPLEVMASAPENIFQGSPMLAKEDMRIEPIAIKDRILTGAQNRFRRNSVLTPGHQLKATIIRHDVDKSSSGGIVLRAGLYNTSASKKLYAKRDAFNTFGLLPGALQVWQLDNKLGEELRHGGSYPIRLVLFDENLVVLADKVLTSAGTHTEFIPAKATQMCLYATDGVKESSLAGWHERSALSLVNTKYLMAKGCLVRPKNSLRIGRKQYTYDTGLVPARSLVLRNIEPEGSEVTGWIETRFPGHVKQVFVLSKNDNTDLDVRLIYTDEQGEKQSVTLVAENKGTAGGESWAAFAIPGFAGGRHFSIWAETTNEAGTQLAGVAGSGKSLPGWSEELSDELSKHDAGVRQGESGREKIAISFKNTLNF